MNPYKTLILSITLVLVVLPGSAQPNKSSDYLVLNTKDTLYGSVAYIKEDGFGGRRFYKKISIIDNAGKRKKYERKKVSSFSKANAVFESFWLGQESQSFPEASLVNALYHIDRKSGEQHFLRVANKGKLSHYELEWFEQGNGTLWSMSLLKKEEDPFFIRADQGLLGLKRKVLLNYFSNCPEIKEAIRQQQVKEVHQVVEFYNDNCIH